MADPVSTRSGINTLYAYPAAVNVEGVVSLRVINGVLDQLETMAKLSFEKKTLLAVQRKRFAKPMTN